MNRASAPDAVDAVFRAARLRLSEVGIASADLDASLLLEHATGLTVLDRITDPERPIPHEKIDRFEECLLRRLAREPVHRIIGEREFYGLPLALNTETLVPRPDTEALVDLVLPFVKKTANNNGTCRILDIGTGTGAIALALLSAVPQAVAIGSDISEGALRTAEANADALGLADRFAAVRSDWFEAITGEFDLIVSNPPYIRSGEIADLDIDVREHDPRTALDGGEDGLDAYRALAEGCERFLEESGAVAVEIGYDQNRDVTNIFERAKFRKSAERTDYSGHDRALFFVKWR